MFTVRAVNLTKKFGDLVAVNGLDLQIEQGEIFGLVGPDGAGKTTTLRLLTGILEPTAGQGWVYDKDIIKESEAIKEHISYMPQRFGLYEDLTVIENINFYADIYGVSSKERNPRIKQLLEFSNLEPFRNRLARNLSGGMKQKLGLACALVHTPKILFLDEPTNGVDPVSRRDFWRILYQLLKEKVTILLSTSYLDEAQRCKRVGLMHKGVLLKCDTPADIKKQTNSKSLEEAFISMISDYERRKS
jgi:ABC-2 type transport system ATP-binding protein